MSILNQTAFIVNLSNRHDETTIYSH